MTPAPIPFDFGVLGYYGCRRSLFSTQAFRRDACSAALSSRAWLSSWSRGKHGQPAGRQGTYGGVLFAVLGARGRVENRFRADLEGGLLVDLDEQEPVEEQVDLGVGDRPFA